MAARPARCTKAEIERYIAAAKKHGWHRIEIHPSGTVVLGDGPPKITTDEKNEWDMVQ